MEHRHRIQYILITKDYFPYHYGGMANYYRGYVDGFGDELRVLIPDTATRLTDDSSETRVKKVRPSATRPSSLVHRIAVYRQAARLIAGFDGKTVLLCGNFRPYLDVCYWLKKKYGVVVYSFFHGNDLLRVVKRLSRNPIKRRKYVRLFRACDGFVANSRYTMSLIPDEYQKNKHLIVAPPGISSCYMNQPVYEPRFDGEFDAQLMTVCRLDHRKGVHRVLESVKILNERGITCFYNVVGKGDLDMYEALASSLGVSGQVAFHGYKTDEETLALLRDTDIFVMPSSVAVENNDVEGFGIVFLEANALGKPVIGANTGGIPDAVEDGASGLLVRDPEDAGEIADKIEALCKDRDRAVQLGRYGHGRVNRYFQYPFLAGKLKHEIAQRFRQA